MYILTLSSLHISNYKQLGVCKLASINPLSKLTLSFDTDKDFFTSNFDQNIKTRGLMQQTKSSGFIMSLIIDISKRHAATCASTVKRVVRGQKMRR